MTTAGSTVRRVTAIRHVAFEDLGSFAEVLEQERFEIDYVEATRLDDLDPLAADLWVVLGGPIGAYEEREYPFLAHELALLERRMAQNLPTLGICLGCQLMARALGARVYLGPRKEIGWAPLRLTPEGRASCLGHLGDAPVLHWHGDTFDLPPGAVRLASTDICDNQAFSVGSAILGLQFHIEATASGLEDWFIGHASEIAATPLVEVPSLRADAKVYAPSLRELGQQGLRAWLKDTGLATPS